MWFSNRPYQQCTKCVMDTTDSEITFNEKGHCNHCTEFIEKTSKRIYLGEESDKALMALVDVIKKLGKDNEYDCLIGISGGIDSCYAAYIAKNLGLRPLAVHMDNGWNSEAAVKNIKNVAGKLGIDYQSYVLDWEEFKDLQLAFLKASVPEAETPTDIAIPAALHRIAAENKIKFIISGGNFATEGILPKSWHYNAKDIRYLKAIHRQFGSGKLKSFPLFGFKNELYYKYIKGIRFVYLLNYVRYSKKDAMKVLEDELGWKYYGGKHYESKFTGFVQSYILNEKFKIDYRKATFSSQICSGEMTRDEALELLKEPPYNPVIAQQEKEYVAKKLSISLPEFDEIMNLPAKSYKDYPNNKRFLELVYNLYRTLNK
jgi:N-acetyl sugar amidotransferase